MYMGLIHGVRSSLFAQKKSWLSTLICCRISCPSSAGMSIISVKYVPLSQSSDLYSPGVPKYAFVHTRTQNYQSYVRAETTCRLY